MASIRATRRSTNATEQPQLEEIGPNRRKNRAGSTTGHRVRKRGEEVRGKPKLGDEDGGHVASGDEMEALRTEHSRLRYLAGKLQAKGESREDSSECPSSDVLVEAFYDFEKHVKVSSAARAVSGPDFKKLVGVTNYEQWKSSFHAMANIHNLWEMYDGTFDALSTTTDHDISVKFRRLSRNAIGILLTACNERIGSSLRTRDIKLPSQAMAHLDKRNRQQGNVIVWSLFKEFSNTTLASTGSITKFGNKLLEVQEKLLAVDTGYRLPQWQINSRFITGLTSAFDSKVAILDLDESIVSVTDPKDFQALVWELIQEEQAQSNNDDNTTLAV